MLRRLREAAGLTQRDLADRAGCHWITIAKLEGLRQEPAWPLVIKLADVLGVKTHDFINPHPEKVPPQRVGRPPRKTME
jgi:DNA-binding XRE family transcriptional regulator